MKIKMLKVAAGPAGTFAIGQVHDLPPHQAMAFIKAGAAERVVDPPKKIKPPAPSRSETATAGSQSETADRE